MEVNNIKVKSSKFILDCIEAGLRRKTRHDKGKVRTMVEIQEMMKQIIVKLGPGEEELKDQILVLSERMIKYRNFRDTDQNE